MRSTLVTDTAVGTDRTTYDGGNWIRNGKVKVVQRLAGFSGSHAHSGRGTPYFYMLPVNVSCQCTLRDINPVPETRQSPTTIYPQRQRSYFRHSFPSTDTFHNRTCLVPSLVCDALLVLPRPPLPPSFCLRVRRESTTYAEAFPSESSDYFVETAS